MTTPTNWPNPERPGFPMFPERDGWHLIIDGGLCACYWHHGKELWWNENKRAYMTIDDITKQTRCVEYIGPVRTPAQIAEMLVAERERCARACEEKSIFAGRQADGAPSREGERYWRGEQCVSSICAEAIRRLGDVER